MCSIKPNGDCGEMDAGEEVAGGLVITRGDGAKLLEFAEEILDEVAGLVKLLVIGARVFAVALGWDYRGLSRRRQRLDHPRVGVERLVGQHGVGFHLRQQRIGAREIMDLARRQQERQWIAQRVNQGVDLGTQSAFAAADRFLLAVFLRAPALC